MNENIFFDFYSKFVLSTFKAHAVGLKIGGDDMEEEWHLIKGDYAGIDFPVIFQQDSGRNLTDILDTGWPSLFLISDRMKITLEENDLTGWKTFFIKLYDKKRNEIFGYHGFSITGHCGPNNYEKSEIIEKRMVPTGPICRYYKGLSIDQWGGADFFTPEGTYQIFISKKAANVLVKNNFTNIRLKNLAEYEKNINDII